MNFTIINKETWNRKEYFEYYISEIPCTYSMTTKLDITKIKKEKHRIYPRMLYLISKVVNNHNEFKTTFNATGELGIFDKMFPCYTVFHKDSETFSNIWTEYVDDYNLFYKYYENDIQAFGSIKKVNAKPNIPENSFPVSMIPWTIFDGFNLNLQKGYNYLLPIFTMGKYYKDNDKYFLPIAIQVHHAVCDGFHICCFINELQELIDG